MILDMTTRGRPSDKPRSAFGEKLLAARERAGLTQAELAQRMGVTQRAVAHWERTSTVLRPEVIEALADALKVSVDELIREKPSAVRQPTGPTGKVRHAFDAVSKLPRRQQDKIVEVVEALVDKVAVGH